MKTFIDLFAGIGGFRLALESFGLKCVFSSEIDIHAKTTYLANFGEVPKGDITQISETEIPSHDVICAGFPCQAFSISGKQKGLSDERGILFYEIIRIAKCHQPKILLLENVKNFEKHDGGNTFRILVDCLKEIGYQVFSKRLIASDFGLPTARERIYFVAFREDLGVKNFEFPKGKKSELKLKDFLQSDDATAKYVINRSDIWITKPSLGLDFVPNRPVQIGIINKGGQGERIYHELGHAITFSAHGGGIASKTGAYLVNGKIRKLSPHESAKIMGFPEDFELPVSDAQANKQLGNSVAVPVIQAIFSEIIKRLGDDIRLHDSQTSGQNHLRERAELPIGSKV
jgi:DNA (cytosine-5)-methyltransferase 1